MDINEKLKKYLGQDIESTLNEEMSDEELFNDMVEFLLDLNDESMDEDQLVRYHKLLEELDSGEDDSEDDEGEEISEVRLLKKTSAAGRRKSRMYYRKNKTKIKARMRKLKPKIARMEKMGKGLSGKKLGLTRQR